MQRDNRLSGAGRPANPRGPRTDAAHEADLLRVQECHPVLDRFLPLTLDQGVDQRVGIEQGVRFRLAMFRQGHYRFEDGRRDQAVFLGGVLREWIVEQLHETLELVFGQPISSAQSPAHQTAVIEDLDATRIGSSQAGRRRP